MRIPCEGVITFVDVGYNHLPEMSISSVPIVQTVIVLSSPRWMARQPFGHKAYTGTRV